MYLSFYGLERQPFHITPDPEFLYLSPSHKAALEAIIHGIEERKGFVAITGAVGAGKTTILRSYLETNKDDSLKIVYVFNAKLTFQGLLKTMYEELGLPIGSSSVMEMVNRLYEFLIEEHRQGNTVVLVIDEAQNMPVDTLESLRMMSDGETSGNKLMQIVLVGQTEFEKALNTDRLRQLRQRLGVRAKIQPLSRAESLEYIRFRIRRAGNDPASVLTTPALKKIVRESKGIPRVLNVLCDNALITGFGYLQKPATKKIAKEIIRDFEGNGRPHFVRRQLPRATALALLLLFIGITWFLPLKRVLFDQSAMSVSREQIEEDDAIRGVRPAKYTAASDDQVREVAARGGAETPPYENEPVVVTKTATQGDTLTHMVRDVYGNACDAAQLRMRLDLVRQSNPQIKNVDLILPGEKIAFPGDGKGRENVAANTAGGLSP